MIHKKIELYENRTDVTLTTYVLDDSPEMLNGKKRPAILVCPGGGYLGCSDREAEPIALRFNTMGYHAFVLRYSTYSNGAPFGAVDIADVTEANPDTMHPAPVRDIGRAFLELHARADEWLLDTDKIAICGFSAGGHNCAMYSVYWDKPLITGHFGEPAEKFRPAVAILGYAICDFRLMVHRVSAPPQVQILRNAANIAFFGTPSPAQDVIEAVSPILHVSENTPPMFLWSTVEDDVVPVENITRMSTALAQAKIPFEAHMFESGGHGLSLADQSTAGSMMQIDGEAAQWITLLEPWLKKRFALSLPEKPDWLVALEGNQQ